MSELSTQPQADLIAVREEDSFDIAAVDNELKQHIQGLQGKPEVQQFTAGASNLTYLLRYPDRQLVLRKPPAGAKPKSGHSMWREYTVIKAIQPAYPSVPNTLYYASHENSVIGAEFYIMERVPGIHLSTKIPSSWHWTEQRTRFFCQSFWDKLIELHQLDYHAVGLDGFGQPRGYIERQIKGWNARYQKALTDDAEAFQDVRDWLDANRPQQETADSILHGDFRIDNLILTDDEQRSIKAVSDWEISALGDPLMDLGAALVYWVEPGDPKSLQSLKKQPSDAPGMFTRHEVVRYYAEQTGRQIDDFTFFYAYGIFRLAAIAQQIYYRYYHQQTTNKAYAMYGPGAKALGYYARQIIAQGMRI